ncbi:putative polysaccharide biosynthesis protein [Paludifilum halophilum]|uniref:Uncharacterized protein n=1 Tax=Paludifilum halophilum TaxID=1642702 RepID=A0A235B451_9BACL|nr:polysaccharide biosynthesis protein [Paludifilum halophilum]OYD06405.1 hypothetical protein CHM34_16045 [Paludifilum halophilum]
MSNRTGRVAKGTLILSGAALLTKGLGTLFWLPLQNIAGDSAMGIYRQTFPLYSILLMLATAGVPITVSRFVSERLSAENPAGARRVMQVSSLILSVSGGIGFFILYGGSEWIARVILGYPRTQASLQVLAFALLIVPVMATLRGYFQGYQRMGPTALSQVVEQLLRVLTVVGVTYWMVHLGFDTAAIAAGATSGAVTGAAGGFFIMIVFLRRDRQAHVLSSSERRTAAEQEPFFALSRGVIRFALPISLGSLVLPLINLLDSVTVPRLLHAALGYSRDHSIDLFGIYGRGAPFVNLIAAFSSALTLALIPSITAHVTKGEHRAVRRKTAQSWLLTAIVGLPSSIGLAILSKPLTIMMYHNESAQVVNTSSLVITELAISTVFSTLAVTSSGILQGLGHNKRPVRNLSIGAAVKVGANLLFIPQMGITGSALAMVAAYLVVCLLNLASVSRYTGVEIQYRKLFLKPALCTGIMAAVLLTALYGVNLYAPLGPDDRWLSAGVSLVMILFGICIYSVSLLLTRTIGESELLLLPRGDKICYWLNRFKIIRSSDSAAS